MKLMPSALVCRDAVELVSDYLDGNLSRRDRRRLEKHLAACDGCQAYLAQVRATVTASGCSRNSGSPSHSYGRVPSAVAMIADGGRRSASAESRAGSSIAKTRGLRHRLFHKRAAGTTQLVRCNSAPPGRVIGGLVYNPLLLGDRGEAPTGALDDES